MNGKAELKNAMKELNLKLTRPLYVLVVYLALIGLNACDENDDITSDEFDKSTVELEVLADADFDEIDDLVGIGMGFVESNPGTRVAGAEDGRFECAEVTIDRENKSITINFGDGCQGPNGRVRSGKIIMTYTGFRFLPGTIITTTLEDFAIDGRLIEGTRTVENVSESLVANPKFHITLSDGKITFLDGTEATREVDRLRIWVRTSNPINDEYHILESSTANGLNRQGVNYEVTVLETLVYKRNCREDRRFLPVSGVKEINKGEDSLTIDFGDGECDNIITITFNGRIVTIEISPNSDS